MKPFTGVIVPIATPLTAGGGVDRGGLERLVEYLLSSGVHALFANGSMGGFAFHPDRRQMEIIQAVAESVRGRVPVLAGISDTSVDRVLEKAGVASAYPVDAFVVLPPYYFLYRQEELLAFFRLVAGRVSRPLVVYENPRLVQNSLAPRTIARLLDHPNIIAVKHSAGDAFAWQEMMREVACRADVSLICGAEKMMALGLQMGFDGMTGGFHNVVPKLAVALYQASIEQDWPLCEALQRKLNSGYRLFETAGGWRGLEAALQYMGIAERVTVPPFDAPVDAAVRGRLDTILREEGVERPYATTAFAG